MNLQELRDFVSNVIDYDATANATYKGQLTKLVSDAYERVASEAPWLFMQEEAPIEAKADIPAAIGATNGSVNLTHTGDLIIGQMDGQVIDIGGTEYTIAYVRDGTFAYLTTAFTGTTGAYTANVINRFQTLPAYTSTVMNVCHRSNTISPIDPGLVGEITRATDETYNLPLGEVSIPRLWVMHDPIRVPAPRVAVGVATVVAAPGQGVRTVEIAMQNRWGPWHSALSAATTVSLTDAQALTLTPALIPNSTGLYRAYYMRIPSLGLNAWRLITDTANVTTVNPVGGVTLTPDTSLSYISGQTYDLTYERYAEDGGLSQRFRFYPRQSEDTTYQVRVLRRPTPLVEDVDVPAIPAAHRVIVAYRALVNVLMKGDNGALSELYAKRAEQEEKKMRTRYLTNTSQRIVMGDMSRSDGSMRYSLWSSLVRLP